MAKAKWGIRFTEQAQEDLNGLDGSIKKQVIKAITKVSENPLPTPVGYGKPLGSKAGINLTGCCKIKLKKTGHRVVYTLERHENEMLIIIISVREESKVYKEAARRLENKIVLRG